jgi:hypothetical protein
MLQSYVDVFVLPASCVMLFLEKVRSGANHNDQSEPPRRHQHSSCKIMMIKPSHDCCPRATSIYRGPSQRPKIHAGASNHPKQPTQHRRSVKDLPKIFTPGAETRSRKRRPPVVVGAHALAGRWSGCGRGRPEHPVPRMARAGSRRSAFAANRWSRNWPA